MKKISTIFVLFFAFAVPFLSFADYDISSAKSYLQNHGGNAWATMALASLNDSGIPDSHLKNISSANAIDYAAPILAITALKKDPRTFGGEDYVARLKSFHTQNQIGGADMVNDDIFGILALISAGASVNDDAVSDAKNFILTSQNQDGGWGFSLNVNSDTNMTSAGILALLAAGVPSSDNAIQNAASYLKASQNGDGGFPYDPNSSWSTASDTASTAWAVWALNALNIEPATWGKENGNPISFLESNQADAGFFEYQKNSGEDAFSPNTTSYAVIALSGKTLPVNIISSPYEEEDRKDLFQFKIEGSNGTICSGETEGPTALDIVKNASSGCGFTYNIQDTAYGPYLKQINGDAAEGLNGWMYAVNNSIPSVGAADYNLADDDFTLWHFGEFGWEPQENNTSQIGLSVTITEGNVQGTSTDSSSIGFTLDSSALDFGELAPGESKSQSFALTNAGTADIAVEAIVTGSDIFKDNLKLDNELWRQFRSLINASQTKKIEARLFIPPSYAGSGQKQGTITIWATAE